MGPVLLGLAAAAVLFALPFASRRPRRVMRAAGGPPARPVTGPAGQAAVPAVTGRPDREERQAFAYDNGLAIEPGGGEGGRP